MFFCFFFTSHAHPGHSQTPSRSDNVRNISLTFHADFCPFKRDTIISIFHLTGRFLSCVSPGNRLAVKKGEMLNIYFSCLLFVVQLLGSGDLGFGEANLDSCRCESTEQHVICKYINNVSTKDKYFSSMLWTDLAGTIDSLLIPSHSADVAASLNTDSHRFP